MVECGTGRGGGGIFLRGYLDAYEMRLPMVWVADTFRAAPEGAAPKDLTIGDLGSLRPDLNTVRDAFERFDLLDDRVRFVQGELDLTLSETPIDKIALLRIGGDLGSSTGALIEQLYDKLTVGGFVVVDDYVEPQCQKAVDGLPRPAGHRRAARTHRLGRRGLAQAPCTRDPGAGVRLRDEGRLGRFRRSRSERRASTLAGHAVARQYHRHV